ncbi:calcium-translocating P-type ATPase, PMCA-type [Prevotella stercorea]|uniref:calcium-translocating P-type ATPase, PMCA-type n=1 Tax=Leyella stercorea TaxID=363265 RepID=UPI001F2B72C0|nr:calcium-translocating P-type ATPase, PMCA-type [Leyella stercorea]MCF2644925.1 calcium-translocating P-type ATPase, PMCA-type [Leyella stercorea]
MESKHHYTGLTAREVAQSRSKYGENVLTPPAKAPLWLQFLDKFRDPLIIILLIAGALSILISCYEYFALGDGPTVFFEPVGIFVAIMLATGLSFYFEYQADKEFAILNKVNDDEPVEVIRDSNTTQIPRREVVVGDIVIVNTGEEIPADGELMELTLLNVDESTLTGEPMCAKTTVASEFDSQATFPSNHVMKGTKVMEGHGIMRVLAIGDHTEQGKVFEAVQIDNSVKTPLDEQLDGLGRLVAKLSYCVGAGIIIGRILMYFLSSSYVQFEWLPFIAYLLQTLMIAVTLVVVSVPEGLPMAVTLSLAYSMRRMLKTNNLVRKMHACETMGATTVICTDKTGTLTQNQMRVDSLQLYGLDEKSSAVAESMALNSTAQLDFTEPDCPSVLGNPTEGALLLWLYEYGTDYRELRENSTIVDQLPFNTERKYMATVVDSALMPGRRILYVKGAPEIVFAMCRTMGEGATRERIENQLLDYQNHAMRTLGFAFQMLDKGDVAISNGRVTATRLHFIGITAIADPVRSDVPDAIKECLDAGINIKIVTGDTPATAREIGRQIGLWNETDSDRNIITGPEFAAMSDEQLLQRVHELKIIARARPMDKKRLVETLQRLNQVVAVTGDGTNDAPALRAAHVGLSMGDGTSVAKEASDITIINNSFSSIGKAVMWGRSLYQNIQRFLLFQLTVNVTACLIVLIGAFMGTESPLTVTQMLWINLIMDTFAAMALASLPPSESVMHDRPRDRHAFILTRPMYGEIVGVGALFFVLLFFFLLVFKHADISSLSDMLSLNYLQLFAGFGTLTFWTEGHLTAYELTLLFTIFVMTHFFYLFNARAFETGRSALHFGGCKGLLTIVVIIFAGQVLMVETPILQDFFNVVSLSLKDWGTIIIGSSLVLWVREVWHLAKAGCCARR